MTTNMNIIDITNDVTEIKEDNTITENTNMTTIEKETTVDEAFAEAVSLIPEHDNHRKGNHRRRSLCRGRLLNPRGTH